MNAGKFSVGQITEFLRKELRDYYPQSEIQQFVFLILEDKLGFSRPEIITRYSDFVDSSVLNEVKDISQQLLEYKPIQYILGWTEFYGLRFNVSPHVLIPRPETEELVDWILKEKLPGNPHILDVGTGSGCIAVALAKGLPEAGIDAIDISENALKLAGENAVFNDVKIVFYHEDILDPSERLKNKKYDLIVSNPPYITPDEQHRMSRNVTDYEPHQALFVPGDQPILYYQAILDFAIDSLIDEGWVYFEINETFSREIADLMKNSNFADIQLRKDINDKFRMIRGRKPAKATETFE